MSAGDAEIRPYQDADFDVLVRAWHETNRESFPYVALQQQHTLDDARRFFRDHVAPVARIWVADAEGELQGLVALEAPWIRQLAVFPPFQRRGIGSALLRAARAASPAELCLYTFFRNAAARAFYERHGFAAIAFGVSPAPESEPDVLYRRQG
jgi:GNAT superfamily N-acetyltransferase